MTVLSHMINHRQKHLDLNGHKSMRISGAIIAESFWEIIFNLINRDFTSPSRTWTRASKGAVCSSIPDPYQMQKEWYYRCLFLISACLQWHSRIIDRILEWKRTIFAHSSLFVFISIVIILNIFMLQGAGCKLTWNRNLELLVFGITFDVI